MYPLLHNNTTFPDSSSLHLGGIRSTRHPMIRPQDCVVSEMTFTVTRLLEMVCDAVLVIYFLVALWRLWKNRKIMTSYALALDTVCQTTLILFVFVTLAIIRNNSPAFTISSAAVLLALLACFLSLVCGIVLGRSLASANHYNSIIWYCNKTI